MKTGPAKHQSWGFIASGMLLALSLFPFNILAEETESVPAATQPVIAPEPAPASDQAAQVKLSQGTASIAKLAQGGVDEQVMLAYIGTVNGKFNLGTDQIGYLNVLGVSGTVVKAMIQRDASLDAAAVAAAAPPAPVSPTPPIPEDISTVPPPPMVDDSTAPIPPANPGDYATSDDSGYFYNSLSPYGAWVIVPGFGLCWRPTVCLGNHDWQPYADRGRWIYSDYGWYWQSDYSWGWAAFHYGRWFNDDRTGWVWQPNRTWSPAWVSWRHSSDYCGWAPLPPSAKFFPGQGFVYGNRQVGNSFDFGLRANQYRFVPIARMNDYQPVRYAVAGPQREDIFARTVVINQVALKNNHVVNPGIDPQEVASASRTEVRRAQIVENSRSANGIGQSDHLSKQGNSLVIVRPQLPAPVQHTPTPATPARNQRSATPLYFKGSSVSSPSEAYPSGSLVVTGPKNVPHFSGPAAYPVAYFASENTPGSSPNPGRSSTSFNFKPVFTETESRETETVATRNGPIVIPGRYGVSLYTAAHSEPVNSFKHTQTMSEAVPHVTRAETHATTQTYQGAGPTMSSHPSSASSSYPSSISTSASSGKR